MPSHCRPPAQGLALAEWIAQLVWPLELGHLRGAPSSWDTLQAVPQGAQQPGRWGWWA